MALVSAHGLFKSYGPRAILDGVDVSLEEGERVGLVGPNGAGKTTLARILAGVEPADQGQIQRRRGSTVGYLAQDPEVPEHLSARAWVVEGLAGWAAAHAAHTALSAELAEAPADELDALLERQAEAAAAVERLGGWDAEHRVTRMLDRLNVLEPDQLLGTMSGGERRRVALARLLVAGDDLLVLDEPTNHLDAETIEWLEDYLTNELGRAVLLVTHDRYLLDRVVQRTLEVHGGRVTSYDGGWEAYLISRAEREAQAERAEATRQNLLRRELEWLSRQPKARTGKQKARIDRAATLGVATDGLPQRSDIRLEVASTRSGSRILEAHALGLRIGERTLLTGLELALEKGERIGIIGRNGVGKTTLLRCLVGQREPDAGSVQVGANTRFAYFDQARSGLDPSRSVIDNVSDDGRMVYLGDRPLSVHTYLDRFLFTGDRQRQLVGALSGGERARVALARLLLMPANVLVLDEPTNDLDVQTLAALEEMILELDGTVLVVTHDRYLLDRLATSVLVLDGEGGVERFPGGYSDYRRLVAARGADGPVPPRRGSAAPGAAAAPGAGSSSGPPSGTRAGGEPALGGPDEAARPPRLTYAEQRELDKLLDRVAAAEAELAEAEAALADPTLYTARGADVPATRARCDAARARVDELTARWEALEARREAWAR